MSTTRSRFPDESAMLELRTHCPRPDVRIVRPTGVLSPVTVGPLVTMVKSCLHDGPADVVLDLCDVRVGAGGDGVLTDLMAQAHDGGGALHVTGEAPRPSTDDVVARLLLARLCAR